MTPAAFDHWWHRKELGNSVDAPHSYAFATLRAIKGAQQFRAAADRMFMRLYSDLRYVGFETYRSSYELADVFEGLLSQNIIKSIIQTAQSKLDKIKIRPKPVTEGGNWRLQYNAEQLDKYLGGMIYEHRADELFSDARLGGMCTGTGGVKVYNDGKRVCAEVTVSSEWWVDASEARYRQPRTFYQEKAYDRDQLIAMFPDFEKELKDVKANSQDILPFFWTGADPTAEMIPVIEAWHIPSVEPEDDEEKTDGRHIICAPGVTLQNREWRRMRPPVAWFRWSLRGRGFWGCGLVEDQVAAQIEYNEILQMRQEAVRTTSAPFWAVEKGSKIVKSHLSDEIGRIVEYTGRPPEVHVPQPVSAALWEHGNAVRQGMYEDSGISQLSASMQKPAGLNSGKALRTYVDMESERIITALQSSEQMVLDYAELVLDESEDLAKQNPKLAVTYVGTEEMERIKWSEASMDRDKFRLKIAPISVLSTTFAGKLEDVKELRDLGLVTEPSEMRQLLGMPDLVESNKRALAMRRRLMRVIETEILRNGKYFQPDPLWDLTLAMTLALEALPTAEDNDYPAENVDLLRQFISEVATLTATNDPAAGAPAPMLETAPMAPALGFAPPAPPGMPPMGPANGNGAPPMVA